MGNVTAPSLANLFMGFLEQTLLSKCAKKPLVWFRYIDDIFFYGHIQKRNWMTSSSSAIHKVLTSNLIQHHLAKVFLFWMLMSPLRMES